MSYFENNDHRTFDEDYDTLAEKQAKQDMRIVKHPIRFTVGLLTAIMILGYILINIE